MKLRSEKEKRFHPQGIEPSRAEEADETVPKRLLELRGGRRDRWLQRDENRRVASGFVSVVI